MTKTQTKRRSPGLGTIRELPSGRLRWEVMVEGRRLSGTAKTRKEAQAAISNKITEATRGGIVDPSTVTVAEYLAQWLGGKRSSRSETSHNIQTKLLERYIAPGIGERKLQKLSPAELRRFYGGLTTLKEPREPLGAASQRQIHQFLKQAFEDALRDEIIPRNVAKIVAPSPPRRDLNDDGEEIDAYNPQEAQAFLAAAEKDHRAWWAAFAMATGMRRGEICGLRWVDINREKGTAVIRENVVDDNGKNRVTTPKTQGSRRTVYLSPYALRLLEWQQEQQAFQKELLNPNIVRGRPGQRQKLWEDSGRVWTTTLGGVMHPGNLHRDMERAYTAAGIRHLRVHGLRDTYASLALMAGIPLEVVSRQLGHADPGFTLRVYRTVFAEERAKWAMDVTDMLAPKKEAITHELRTRAADGPKISRTE